MNRVEAALRRLVAELVDRRAACALVGGFAVSARAEPRFTRDVDVAVAVRDDAGAEAFVRSMVADGYGLVASVEQDVVGRLATVRLASPGPSADEVIVDLLFASSGIEPEVVAAAEPLEIIPGLIVPIARTGHLLALKLLARDDETRPQDAGDIRALRAVADQTEIDVAWGAVDLITERQFNRGRDLRNALADLLAG